MKRRGKFITFEGGEGAGKTTLIARLAKALEDLGAAVLCTRAPGSLGASQKIRELLLHRDAHEITPKAELFLFLADRALHVEKEIIPALEEGKVILCDRFNDSTIAYQGIARGFGEGKIRKLIKMACGDIEPHLTFYLDIDPLVGLKRASSAKKIDRIESESVAFHQKIRQAYLHLAELEKKRIVIIDATESLDHVYAAVWNHLRKYLTDDKFFS